VIREGGLGNFHVFLDRRGAHFSGFFCRDKHVYNEKPVCVRQGSENIHMVIVQFIHSFTAILKNVLEQLPLLV
jgi:hypothetical protein